MAAAYRQHPALRPVLLPSGYEQKVLPRSACKYGPDIVDLSSLDRLQQNAAVERIRRSMDHRVYDPRQWPCFGVSVVRLNGERSRIHVSLDNLFIDGSSSVMLLEQWALLYRKLDAILPLPGLSFRSYCSAAADYRVRRKEKVAEDLDYWVARLDLQANGPRLPFLPRPQGDEPARRRRFVGELEPQAYRRLVELATESGVTPTALLLAAFKLVLRAWSREPDFGVILTLFRREPLHADVNRIIGAFTSTAVLHTEVPAARTLEDQAKVIHRQLWEDLSHASVSGIVATREYYRRKRKAPASIEVVFTSLIGHVKRNSDEGGPVDGRSEKWWAALAGPHGRTQTPRVALDHQVFDIAGRLYYFWDVDEARFIDDVPEELFSDYEAVIDALVQDARWWDERPADLLLPRMLHTMFLRRAVEQPHAVALIAGDARLTYAELRQRSANVARRLLDQGVSRGALVPVFAPKGAEQVIAALGVLMAGAGYVPIERGTPPDRVRHILETIDARTILTTSMLVDSKVWPSTIRTLAISVEAEALDPGEHPRVVQHPSDTAYVIFTSGTTGEPKGVALDHLGPVNTIREVNAVLGATAADRLLAVSELSFDLSVYDIFGMLAAGGLIVMPEPHQVRDPKSLVNCVKEYEITLWNTVPTFVDLIEASARATTGLDSLRAILMSGDWIPVALLSRLRETCPGARLVSLGGATEASVWSIMYPIEEVDPSWKSVPYGRPMRAQPWWLIEDGKIITEIGRPAQLHIGGVGLAQGYWKDDKRTEAAFIEHPKTGARIYATGDLGQLRPDGTYEFLGRTDQQVKINGFRVELGEIEARLESHPKIARALVVAMGQAGDDRSLAAFVVAQSTSNGEAARTRPSREELSAYMGEWLPAYMVPSRIVYVSRIPATANGKVDRRPPPAALYENLSASSSVRGLNPRAGGSPKQEISSKVGVIISFEAVRDIAKELMGVDVPNPDSDLFDLGATSLTIMRLTQRIYDKLGTRVSAVQLFEQPCLATVLSAALCAQKASSGSPGDLSRSSGEDVMERARRSAEDQQGMRNSQILLDAGKRDAFKREARNLRQTAGLQTTLLETTDGAERDRERACLARVSHRTFEATLVPYDVISRLLERLRPVQNNGGWKYEYPSAGATYPLQVYVEIPAGRVQGIEGGVFTTYHPVQNCLAKVSDENSAQHHSF